MSLSGLLTALVEYVGDVLVNDAGRPEPDRVLRYHGPLPHDCCTEAGLLTVSWSIIYGSSTFPAQASGQANDPCHQSPVATVVLRYVVCWPTLDGSPPQLTDAYDADVDDRAAGLADAADSVARALIRLNCEQGSSDDPSLQAVLDEGRARWMRFIDATPIVPLGGCAGVQWRMYAAPRHEQVVS